MASFRLLVLAFVREYFAGHSASPSYGEIAAALDSNRTRVRKAVKSLERDGMILRSAGPRGLKLPSVRDEAVRQLRELGWQVDEDLCQATPAVTKGALPPRVVLDYPSARSDGGANGETGARARKAG
ncbi:hypothetical protein [Altererythrobacter sp. B11]|uniref:hypothetical protein n=1 Tax=Altererythrobacter sp. B11 TaxID=2060312 RepID=UPI000E5C2AC3|nr:hypothetical protein [Altererythrobacter sp. B11]